MKSKIDSERVQVDSQTRCCGKGYQVSCNDKRCRREAEGLKFSWVTTKGEWVPQDWNWCICYRRKREVARRMIRCDCSVAVVGCWCCCMLITSLSSNAASVWHAWRDVSMLGGHGCFHRPATDTNNCVRQTRIYPSLVSRVHLRSYWLPHQRIIPLSLWVASPNHTIEPTGRMSSDAFEQRDTGTQLSEFDDHCIGVNANDWRDATLRESLDGWRRRNKGLHSGWNNPLQVVHSRSKCMWCMHMISCPAGSAFSCGCPLSCRKWAADRQGQFRSGRDLSE